MKIDRLLCILNLLANNEKITTQKLSEKLEVSKRTIYRDLNTLTMAGIPIVSYAGVGGGIGIIEGYRFDKSILSKEDMKNIITGLNGLKSIDENQKLNYLIDRLMPKNMDVINDQSDIIIDLSQWFSYDDTKDMINVFRRAILNHQCIFIEYHTKGIFSERTLEPYKLVFKSTDWYLYAYCKVRNDFRLFKINRISSSTILSEHFEPKKIDNLTFELETQYNPIHLAQEPKLNKVILEYQLSNKEFLIDKLGAQHFKEQDGIGVIDFYSPNLDWTADLVMSLQDKVKVISPLSLKDTVICRINKMKNLYKC